MKKKKDLGNEMKLEKKIYLFASEVAGYANYSRYSIVSSVERLLKRVDDTDYKKIIGMLREDLERKEDILKECIPSEVFEMSEEISEAKSKISELRDDLENKEGIWKNSVPSEKKKMSVEIKNVKSEISELTDDLEKKEGLLKECIPKEVLLMNKDIKKTTSQIKKVTLSKNEYIKEILGSDKVDKIIDSKYTVETKKRHFKKMIEESIELDNDEKDKLKKDISTIVYTDYGVKGEKSIIEEYNRKKFTKLDESQEFKKSMIFEIETDVCIYKISIGGKMDGVDHIKRRVVEVKNRVNRLFGELREYEKVQLMCYLHITGYEDGVLVENYKGKSREYKLKYDKEYMNEIIERLRVFCQEFIKMIESPIEVKSEYYKMDDESKDEYMMNILDKVSSSMDEYDECIL